MTTQEENSAFDEGVKSERLRIESLIGGMRIPNDKIEETFGCYNQEGNIRMQDGYHAALTAVLEAIKGKQV